MPTIRDRPPRDCTPSYLILLRLLRRDRGAVINNNVVRSTTASNMKLRGWSGRARE
jgi:hypothetical protein